MKFSALLFCELKPKIEIKVYLSHPSSIFSCSHLLNPISIKRRKVPNFIDGVGVLMSPREIPFLSVSAHIQILPATSSTVKKFKLSDEEFSLLDNHTFNSLLDTDNSSAISLRFIDPIFFMQFILSCIKLNKSFKRRS